MTNDLPWFERIRKRPGMYVGPTDLSGVYNLIWDAISEAVDTPIAGACRRISVTIHPDCALTIAYDGTYPEAHAADPRLALTDMATQYGWQPRRGLVPLPVMNALSENLTLETFTRTRHFYQRFRGGLPVSSVEDRGPTTIQGRRIHFLPDRTIFSGLPELAAYPILGHLRTVAALAPQLRAQFSDERLALVNDFLYQEGMRSYLIERDYDRNPQPRLPFFCAKTDAGITAEVAFYWYYRGLTHISSYVNWRATSEGGSHVAGFWRGLAHSLDQFARQSGIFQADIPPLQRRDVPQPLTAIIAVRTEQPHYRGASRDIFHDAAVKAFIDQMLQEQLPAQFAADPSYATWWLERHASFRRDKDT